MFFLDLSKTKKPKPAFTSKPPRRAPNEMLFDKNNSVNKIEDAQLGISPITQA